MSSREEWVLEISFPRPYEGVEVERPDGHELVISIPFITETSAQFAREELQIRIRPRIRVIEGETVDESRIVSGEVTARRELEQ